MFLRQRERNALIPKHLLNHNDLTLKTSLIAIDCNDSGNEQDQDQDLFVVANEATFDKSVHCKTSIQIRLIKI